MNFREIVCAWGFRRITNPAEQGSRVFYPTKATAQNLVEHFG